MSESPRVYLVWSGEYEGRDVVRAFSTRAKAEAFVGPALHDEHSDYAIEERAVDIDDDVRVRECWTVAISVSGGAVKDRRYMQRPSYDEVPSTETLEVYGPGTSGNDITVCSYVSYEHAVAVAVERRREYRAQAGGGEIR